MENNKKEIKRVALVTGSTSGIGKAIAEKLYDDGFAIAFHSKSSVEVGQKLADSLPECTYYQADLSDQEQVKQLVANVLNQYGRLDVLVNNAGISEIIPHNELKQASPEVWRKLYEVNVIAPWVLISEAENALKESSMEGRRSSIINISSHAGVRPKGASIPYSATKAALNHMTKLLAVTLSPDICVNAIAPGLVNTPMTQTWVNAQNLWKEKAPMARGAEPKEIAHIASMLISSGYVTGEVVMVDGGLNLT